MEQLLPTYVLAATQELSYSRLGSDTPTIRPERCVPPALACSRVPVGFRLVVPALDVSGGSLVSDIDRAFGAIAPSVSQTERRPALAPPGVGETVEPISTAEARVLSYLPTDLTAWEIASELCLSVNTVKTHMRHIYAKLDAHRRREAVERARALGLLPVHRLRHACDGRTSGLTRSGARIG
jgi:DNA-binding CsgD family transcriptional regulator